jgi:CBS domain containing-hemolysin-like protein
MSDSLLLLLVAVFLLTAGIFAGYETGLYSLNRVRLRVQSEIKSFGSRSLSRLLADLPSAISTMLVGTNLSHYFCAALVTQLCEQNDISVLTPAFAATLILTPIIFVFSEVVPKDLFRRHADQWTYYLAPALRVFHWAVYPLSYSFRTVGRLAAGASARSAEETPLISSLGLRALISESREEGVLTPYQTAIAANITHLQAKRVGEIMVPLDRAATVASAASPAELEAIVRRSDYSRLPVFEGQKDHIVGIVNVFDLLYSDQPKKRVADLLRPAPFLDEKQGIYPALVRLRRARMPMGIVRDAAGHAIGIVTIKDLVEEIVGEMPGL